MREEEEEGDEEEERTWKYFESALNVKHTNNTQHEWCTLFDVFFTSTSPEWCVYLCVDVEASSEHLHRRFTCICQPTSHCTHNRERAKANVKDQKNWSFFPQCTRVSLVGSLKYFFFHPLQNENYITVTVRSQHCASTKWTRITSTSSSAHMRRILAMFPGSRICVTKYNAIQITAKFTRISCARFNVNPSLVRRLLCQPDTKKLPLPISYTIFVSLLIMHKKCFIHEFLCQRSTCIRIASKKKLW